MTIRYSGQLTAQNSEEIAQLQAIAKDCTRYLEIGVRYGDTLLDIGFSMPPGSLIVGLDLPESRWGRKGSAPYFQAAVEQLCAAGYQAVAIMGNSHQSAILKQVKPYAPFDLILIDGDHTLPGVTQDWEMYGPLGKIIAFHDIVKAKKKILVHKLWASLKKSYRHQEFIAPESRMGIGVLWR